MRAFQVHELGQPPRLSHADRAQPGAGELEIKIETCGLNFGDLLMITGEYQERPPLPFTLGMEFAGTVVAHGPGVSTPAIGTRVAAFTGQGGLAEFAVVSAERCTPIPDTMSSRDAAAFIVAYGTSHVALNHKAQLKPGETLLVLGAAGGVGLTAVELGKAMGAKVIACARGDEKLAVAKAAGADHLFDSSTTDIRSAVKELGGADVVYDPVGGDQFTSALRSLKPEGRMIVVGFASGTVPPIPANLLLVKNISVIGYYWGGYLAFAPNVISDSLTELFAMHADGKLTPHVSHCLPLAEANDGFDLLRNRKSTGKVIIEI